MGEPCTCALGEAAFCTTPGGATGSLEVLILPFSCLLCLGPGIKLNPANLTFDSRTHFNFTIES